MVHKEGLEGYRVGGLGAWGVWGMGFEGFGGRGVFLGLRNVGFGFRL